MNYHCTSRVAGYGSSVFKLQDEVLLTQILSNFPSFLKLFELQHFQINKKESDFLFHCVCMLCGRQAHIEDEFVAAFNDIIKEISKFPKIIIIHINM